MADARIAADGARLGKYQLLRRLATGGMAELFLARAAGVHGFEKLVVLKRILPQHQENDEFIRMFLTEARLAATLHHPNIVQVYDIGEHAGTCFFTMEWVQGQDLRKLVRAARKAEVALPFEHILHIITGVAAGLDHAHDKRDHDGTPLGIVHRDVSPSNVLVTYDGAVKLVDFGIAKAASAQSSTVVGTLKGKIPYMSPEQCRGENVDRRSDVFSIGTLLWEMTTGSRLFAGDHEIAILNRVAAGDVPLPSTVRPGYPPELERIVMRALQADPANRYQTAMDLQIDLEDFAREARLPVSPARLAKFMRELFAEEIEQAAAQLQLERIEGSMTSGAAFSLGANERTVVESSNDGVDVPSELLARSTPTPRTESDLSQPSVTRAQQSHDDFDGMPRRRVWPWVAAAALLAVGGAGSAFAVRHFRGTTDDGPTVTTTLRSEVPPEPEDPKSTAEVAVPVVAAPPVPASDPTPTAPSVPPQPETEPDPTPDSADPSTPPRPTDTVAERKPSSGGSRSGRKSKQRDGGEPKKPTPTPPATKKPTWDPDDPLPPPN